VEERVTPISETIIKFLLMSFCIVSGLFLLYLFIKIPFGGAYKVTWATFSFLKWCIVSLWAFLTFAWWIDTTMEKDKKRKL
jgi:hypothetical protein